jgi:predicted DNA-binding WGR domain protein
MVISQHVTEFADYPVEDYDPAVGILLPVMPRREFRTGSGESDPFWAITLEGDRHLIESGTVGSPGKTATRKFPTAEKAQASYRKLIAEKVAAGYVLSLPRREFELVAGRSQKFWAIEVLGESYTVQFGRIGTTGQTQTKEFTAAAEARSAAEKLIAEKIAKGYTEKNPVAAGSLLGALFSALMARPEDRASQMALSDYLNEQGQQPHPVAYRVSGGEEGDSDALDALLADPLVSLVQALVIGFCFGAGCFDEDSSEVVAALVKARDRLPRLRALFLGDITSDENEISWLNQCDITGLLTRFPQLEHFRARGGGELALRKFTHEHLKSLTFEASNLPREVVRAIGASSLPALEHLEIWLGTSMYGGYTTVADLKNILAGKPTPSLRYLGLRNSEIADDVALALAHAPVLDRLRVLDLSLGTLGNRGAEALLATPGLARLEKLDIHHHYVSPALVERLQALGIEIDASDAEEPEDPDEPEAYRYVAHSE